MQIQLKIKEWIEELNEDMEKVNKNHGFKSSQVQWASEMAGSVLLEPRHCKRTAGWSSVSVLSFTCPYGVNVSDSKKAFFVFLVQSSEVPQVSKVRESLEGKRAFEQFCGKKLMPGEQIIASFPKNEHHHEGTILNCEKVRCHVTSSRQEVQHW